MYVINTCLNTLGFKFFTTYSAVNFLMFESHSLDLSAGRVTFHAHLPGG